MNADAYIPQKITHTMLAQDEPRTYQADLAFPVVFTDLSSKQKRDV